MSKMMRIGQKKEPRIGAGGVSGGSQFAQIGSQARCLTPLPSLWLNLPKTGVAQLARGEITPDRKSKKRGTSSFGEGMSRANGTGRVYASSFSFGASGAAGVASVFASPSDRA